jgi:DNA-binding LytR/AlgR family response regulator
MINNKLNLLIIFFKEHVKAYFSLSLGIFLFILFFQPFSIEKFDFNSRLLFEAGFGLIAFIFLVPVQLIFFRFLSLTDSEDTDNIFASYLSGFILLVVTSTAFAFYLRYVGMVNITFHVMLKIVLICLSLPVILSIHENIKQTGQRSRKLLHELRVMQDKVNEFTENYTSKTIELISEISSDNIVLHIASIVYVKSADNYVEIGYKEGDDFKKKMLRNTLKNIDQQLKIFSNFVRTHRTCIVNIQYIEKLNRNYNTYWLSLSDTQIILPVARQYLMVIKELL